MGDAKEESKRQKKAIKAEQKQVKKLGKAGVDSPVSSRPSAADVQTGRTPAERSAAAAERQVKLQKLRVFIALIAVLIALAGFLITVRPWQYLGPRTQPAGEASSSPRPAPE